MFFVLSGTKVFEKLCEELLKTRLVNDLKKMSPLAQTSSVESFHSVMLHFLSKDAGILLCRHEMQVYYISIILHFINNIGPVIHFLICKLY